MITPKRSFVNQFAHFSNNEQIDWRNESVNSPQLPSLGGIRDEKQFIVKYRFPLDSFPVLYYNIPAESIHNCLSLVITSDNEMITGVQAGRMAGIL